MGYYFTGVNSNIAKKPLDVAKLELDILDFDRDFL